jgi:site-specific DNA-methyltransferase (adenine-specific)
MMKLINGDCLDELKKLEDNSIDACITDPPAGISFMNKSWDHDKGGRDEWMRWMTMVFTEVLRVLKPGGHSLVWSIPRTSHWTAMSLENAGFEIRDCVYHLQGQGFPKSLNVSKAIDKKFGLKGEIIGKKKGGLISNNSFTYDGWYRPCKDDIEWQKEAANIRAAVSEESQKYDGYGSQLKPAVEVWWLIRKPFKGSIVDCVLEYGTGALNIDKSRIGVEERTNPIYDNSGNYFNSDTKWKGTTTTTGRFPANLIHDGSDVVLKEFHKYGNTKSGKNGIRNSVKSENHIYSKGIGKDKGDNNGEYGDEGSVARFFYCTKTLTGERNTGCEEMEDVIGDISNIAGKRLKCRTCGKWYITSDNCKCEKPDWIMPVTKNNHPTVKSVKLMSYLINLIMPPNGIVLDPFMGSGTTGIAALLNGYDFIGIEKQEEYMLIAEARINKYEEFRKYLK